MNQTDSIDNTIGQVERLYRSLTGREAPPLREQPYATIPPEKVPEEHVQEQVDRLVETLAEFSGQGVIDAGWKPPISMWEGPNEVLISVDLPGVSRDTVQVAVRRGNLEIQGMRPPRASHNGEQLDLKYSEHSLGKFRRTIPLPPGMALDQFEAQMRGGVLEIRMPRPSVEHEVKTIYVG